MPPGDDHGTAKCCPAQLAAWKSLRAKIKRDPQHILLQSEFPPEPAASAGKVIPIFFLWARSLFMLQEEKEEEEEEELTLARQLIPSELKYLERYVRE